jgi:hypothetical protein
MKIITLKESYGNDDILEQFPKPDYSHISKRITVSDAKWIPFNMIHIDEDIGNIARSNKNKEDLGSRVDALVISFTAGVLTNQELGAVVHRGVGENGEPYKQPYKLAYAFGRTLAQMEIGVDGWAFNVIAGTEKEIEDACSYENEDPLPKTPNKEQDIISIKSGQVKKGTLSNKEEIILADLRKTYPRRANASILRIAAGIFEENNTSLKYAYYTSAKIKLWRNDHCFKHFEIDGGFDQDLKQWGYTSKKGGLYRTIHRSLTKYAETGFPSYVHVFGGQVTKGSTMELQREAIIDEYITLRVNHAIVYGKDVKFLTLKGFFPQIFGKDKWCDFVPIDQELLEDRVQRSINGKKCVK